MGLGRLNGKRYEPITPWQGSWAQKMEEKRRERIHPHPSERTAIRESQAAVLDEGENG